MDLITISKNLKYSILISLTISPIVMLLVMLPFSNAEFTQQIDDLNTLSSSSCEFVKTQIDESLIKPKDESVFKNYNLNIRNNFENIKCIGKVMNVDSEPPYVFYIGTTALLNKLYQSLGNLIILFFMIFFSVSKKEKVFNFLCFLSFNILIFYFYDQEYSEFNSISGIEIAEPNQVNVIIFIYIAVLIAKFNNSFLLFLAFVYFIIFQIDYLPVLFLCDFIFNKTQNKTITDAKKFSYVAVTTLFYVLRIFTGLSTNKGFDNLWQSTGQRIYSGVSRYDDLRKNLFGSWCLQNNDPECVMENGDPFLPGGGILERFLPFNGDVNSFTIQLGSLLLLTVLFIYYFIIFKTNSDLFLVTFLFLSPAMNFLTFLLNVDLIILLISTLVLIRYESFPRIFSSVIFILSLYKLHPMGILLGLGFYAYKNKSKKIMNFNIILFFLSLIIFILDKLIYNFPTALATLWVQTYGFLNTSMTFSRTTGLDWIYIYIALIIIYLCFTFSRFNDYLYKNVNFEQFIDSYIIYGLLFWFLPTILYINHSYRLPLFYVLFYLTFLNSKKNIKLLIFLMLALNPVIYTDEIIKNILLIINNLAIFVISSIYVKYIYNEHFKQYFLTKLNFTMQLRNKSFKYID